MILAFRIEKEAFAHEEPGEGARFYGGRWNPPGIPVLYTSDSIALAALETLANMAPNFPEPEDDFCGTTYGIPDKAAIRVLEPSLLPHDWLKFPAPLALAEVGRQWAEDKEHLVLKVPSVVVRGTGWNYLFNPRYQDFNIIQRLRVEPFTFDARLLL